MPNSVMKKRIVAAVLPLTLLTLVAALTSSAAWATSPPAPKPVPKPSSAVCSRNYHGHVTCNDTQTTAKATSAATAKTAPGKPTPTAPVDKATIYDGQYAGTAGAHVHITMPSSTGAPPMDKSNAGAIHFTVSHGVLSWGSQYQISSMGQVSVVISVPGAGRIGGTLYFVLGANGAVSVHGDIQGLLNTHGAVTTVTEKVTASRTSH